jgi:hypothetical protein
MTEVFQIILAVMQLLGLIFLAGFIAWQRQWMQILKDKREEVLQKQAELTKTLEVMNKFHNENVQHKKEIDVLVKQHSQQLSALTQASAANKPSFVR